MTKVYIDSNVFFYARIMDRAYGDACSKVLRRIAAREIDASASAIVPIEVANAMRKYGLAKHAVDEINGIFSLGMEIYAIDGADAREAAQICDEVGISPYDCLHAAVMRRNRLEEIVSADRDFDRIGWLRRLDPRFF